MDVIATATPNIICQGGTSQLNASVTGASGTVDYSWTSVPEGFTSNIANPVVNVTQTTIYKIPAINNANTSCHYVKVTVANLPTADAGNDGSVCSDLPFYTNGSTATNYSSILWTSSGDGTFNDPTIINPTYLPGSNDRTDQFTKIYLSVLATSPCTATAIDSLSLNVYPSPVIDAGDNFAICANNTIQLSGGASVYSSLQWTTSGSGTFDNATVLNPVYTPSANDINTGFVNLTLTAQSIAPCITSVSDIVMVTIRKNPLSNAGYGGTICVSSTFNLNGSASNYCSVKWTTSGGGFFNDQFALSIVYNPAGNDLNGGTIVLTLTAFPMTPCAVPAISNINQVIKALPNANAGVDKSFCTISPITLSGTASNYCSILWTGNGSGTFMPGNSLISFYLPDSYDLEFRDTITITLKANPLSPCTAPKFDFLYLFNTKRSGLNAGNDTTLCLPSQIQLSAKADSALWVRWYSSGSGSFSDTTEINPVYYFSAGDLSKNCVKLAIKAAFLNRPDISTDTMVVFIQKNPVANAGNDLNFCSSSQLQLTGTAMNHNSVGWTTNGTGTFNQTNILNPIYTPSAADLVISEISLTMTTYPKTPCVSTAIDSMKLIRISVPAIEAGGDIISCDNSPVQLNGNAQGYSSVLWQSCGSGSFVNIGTLNPVYLPSGSDVITRHVMATLTATFASPCVATVSDELIISFQKNPIADAGENQTICHGQTIVTNGYADNYSQVYWTTSGDGTFSDNAVLQAGYIPGSTDMVNGFVYLKLFAIAQTPCSAVAVDSLLVSIIKNPTVFAGEDVTTCGNQSVQVSGSAANYSSLVWTSSGTGNFSDQASLNSTYFPSNLDIELQHIELLLTAQPISPCTAPISDGLTLNLIPAPIINAGEDFSVCKDGYAELNAQVSSYESTNWTTSGDGYFENPLSSETMYFPGDDDLINAYVILNVTAFPFAPCDSPATSELFLIGRLPLGINAGADSDICENEGYRLSGTAVNYDEIVWTTDGSGDFSDIHDLNAIYTPSDQDAVNGQVTLTLTGINSGICSEVLFDQVQLIIHLLPLVDLPENITSCGRISISLTPEISNFTDLLWTTSGTGTFSNLTSIPSIYLPSLADYESGSVQLTLFATNDCGTGSYMMTVDFEPGPEGTAGSDQTICSGDVVFLSEAHFENEQAVLWFTLDGMGFFDNDNIENPTYYSCYFDTYIGTIHLIVMASALSPCEGAIFDTVAITFAGEPEVFAGNSSSICLIEPFIVLNEAIGTNQESLTWTTSGAGSFDDPNSLNTNYYPSVDEIETGIAELTLTASNSCGVTSSSVLFNIVQPPSGTAGADRFICSGDSVYLADVTFENQQAVLWYTLDGLGVFNSNDLLNPIYYPSAFDPMFGSIHLIVMASSTQPCNVAFFDTVTVTFKNSTEAFAGYGGSKCLTDGIIVLDEATASGYNHIEWSSNGEGYFIDPFTLNPQYVPGSNDLGSTGLIFTMEASGDCNGAISMVNYIISGNPTAEAGDDQTVCEGIPVEIHGAATNYSQAYWAVLNGTGYFENSDDLTTTYVPSQTDFELGSVLLMLVAAPVNPCNFLASDTLTIELISESSFEIQHNLSDVSVTEGDNVTFSFLVSGPQEVEYQWYGPSGLIAGANEPELTLTTVRADDAGIYYCEAMYYCGVIESFHANLKVNIVQILQIPAGWSGISSYVTPREANLDSVFGPNKSFVQLMQNDLGGVYWPDYQINTIGSWNNDDGYPVKLSASIELTITGNQYSNYILELHPGWNYLPVLSKTPLSITDLLNGLNEVKIVKEIAGCRLYWPEYGINTLMTIEPGKAYMLLNQSDHCLEFRYFRTMV